MRNSKLGLILIVLAFMGAALPGAIPSTERQALIAFNNVTGGNSLTNNSGRMTPSFDTLAPNAPVVSGTTPTNDTTPTWTWETGGGGNGIFRSRLDDPDLSAATETTEMSFTPDTPLSKGSHTLYVQERDTVGDWSGSGSKEIIINMIQRYVNMGSTAGGDGTTNETTGAHRAFASLAEALTAVPNTLTEAYTITCTKGVGATTRRLAISRISTRRQRRRTTF